MNKNKSYNKNNPKTQTEESAALMKEFTGISISINMRNDTSHANSYQNKKNNRKNSTPKYKSCNDRCHISSACKSPECDQKRSFHHHKMSPIDEKNDRRNKWKNKSDISYTKSRSPDKSTTITISTPPHLNRRKHEDHIII